MERSKYHRVLFLFSAVWNWAFCAILFILSRVNIAYFLLVTPQVPNNLLWFDLFVGFLFVLGVGYYYVSVDFNKNRNIVRMGIIIKAFKALVFTSYVIIGFATSLMILFAGMEVVFVILFLEDHLMST